LLIILIEGTAFIKFAVKRKTDGSMDPTLNMTKLQTLRGKYYVAESSTKSSPPTKYVIPQEINI